MSSVDILIYDQIGPGGVTAKSIVNTLRANPGAKLIRAAINSPGGYVSDSVAIYNALRSHGARVEVDIDGIAYSGASIVAMAGDVIRMSEGATMMIHQAWALTIGNADDHAASVAMLGKIDDGIIAIYARRTGRPASQIRRMLEAETWFTADEAVEAGFATEVKAERAIAACFDIGWLNLKTPHTAQISTERRAQLLDLAGMSGDDIEPVSNAADHQRDSGISAERRKQLFAWAGMHDVE